MTAIHHFWLSASPYSAVVVSGLFPAYATDGVAPALSLVGGNLVEMPRPADSVAPTLALASGTLQTVLVGAQDLGGIGASLALTAGTLVSGLASMAPAPEAMAPTLALTAGSLTLSLISTTPAPEGISSALALTSGTLT
ncbi:hypothetical protein UFOVP60_6 [uncultured Caudovirales phage]|uniref:Uncharacterized protein n=1 Tax=uncultured Caudovirales phage TaxID=2100421 RepID=A0A6J5T8W3_9CAUD|nr:hypothetical protein UFOVP60_6 [uncultured Caudovirales phage]